MPSKKDRKCRLCPTKISRENLTGLCVACFNGERKATAPSERVKIDLERKHTRAELETLRKKYDTLLNNFERQERELRSLGALGDQIDTFTIEPKKSSGTSEATPVLVASDWHIGEKVTLAQTSGRNQSNPEVVKQRVERFFRSGLNLVMNHLAPGVSISTMVVPLLGDFINNHLHEEAAETNTALPMHELILAEGYIASGLQYFLDNSPYEFVVPCKSGNHGRTTHKNRFATECGHSLEYLMYVHLASYFRAKGETRIQFQINEGYHDYLNVYDQVLRLHHGHAINYGGGIGGIFIPAFKAISQWDKIRQADLDIFGHFHQSKDGGKFVSNGSLVGFNSYALTIKADYEQPKQSLILVDKKRGRTCNWPVLL